MAYPGGVRDGEGPQAIAPQIRPDFQLQRQRMARLAELVQTQAPPDQIAEATRAAADAIGGDRFQVMKMLPHFIQAAAKNVDAQAAYEHFRLPGHERIVHDRRGEVKGGEEKVAKKETARARAEVEFEIRKGKLAKPHERTYENYLGDRMGRGVLVEREEVEGKLERLLSAFEELILARFEGGREVAKESADGKPKFLAKTEAQWKEFFSKFLDRMVAKKVSLDEIREFLFRGVVPKGNKGVVISDMILNDGRIEKFVRFSVIADALARLKAMLPGDVFGRDRLGMAGEEFMYLALAVARGKELAVSPLPTAGKFMLGSTEEKAAQELGIPIGGQQAGRAAQLRARGRRSPFTGLFDEREGGEPEELPYQFIPWWHWANLKRPSPFRWATVVFYASLLAIALMGIGVLTYRLLSGGL